MLDLHMHLDGSLPISVVRQLMSLNYSTLTDDLKKLFYNDENLRSKLQVPSECDSLSKYLECFDLPLDLLQTEESMKLAVIGLLEQLKAEGMRYVEIRFAPQLHSRYCNIFEKTYYEKSIIQAAIDASHLVQGIRCNFILCMMRHGNTPDNIRTLALAEDFKNKGVVAVDLAGDEACNPTCRFRSYFNIAKERNLDFTIHAGEAGNMVSRVFSVRDAIEYGAKRIGHGVAMVTDSTLISLCKDRGIGIECCPTSNVQTRAVSSIENHPIYEFMKEDVKVSVNTDNRTVSNTTIEKEFEILGVTEREKNILIKNAIDMAFLSDKEKKEIFPEWA